MRKNDVKSFLVLRDDESERGKNRIFGCEKLEKEIKNYCLIEEIIKLKALNKKNKRSDKRKASGSLSRS